MRAGIALEKNTTRTERIEIRLALDKGQCDKHAEDIELLLKCNGQFINPKTWVQQGDTFKLTYSFFATYLGKIEQCLNAVANILDDPTVVVACEHNELKHGECLIERVLSKLQLVEQRLALRQ